MSSAQPLLRIDGVSRRFGGLTAVRDVSLDVLRGQIVGVVGPNGAGKTTLFRCVVGALRPNRTRRTLSNKSAAHRK